MPTRRDLAALVVDVSSPAGGQPGLWRDRPAAVPTRRDLAALVVEVSSVDSESQVSSPALRAAQPGLDLAMCAATCPQNPLDEPSALPQALMEEDLN